MDGLPFQHRASIGAFAERMLSPSWQQRAVGRRGKSDGGNERSGFSLAIFLQLILLISVISNVKVPTVNNTWIYVGQQQQGFIILQREIMNSDMTGGETVTRIVSICKSSITRLGISLSTSVLDRVSVSNQEVIKVTSSPSISTEQQSMSSVLHLVSLERMLACAGHVKLASSSIKHAVRSISSVPRIDIHETKTTSEYVHTILYEQMYVDIRREAEVGKSEQEKMMDLGNDSKVGIAVALNTLLTNAQELGNIHLKEGLEMILVMARSDE